MYNRMGLLFESKIRYFCFVPQCAFSRFTGEAFEEKKESNIMSAQSRPCLDCASKPYDQQCADFD